MSSQPPRTEGRSPEALEAGGAPFAGIPDQWIANFIRSPQFAAIMREQWGYQWPVEEVSELPRTPFDGQRVEFIADATNGVTWELVYRPHADSDYPWKCIGGTPLVAYDAGPKTVNWTGWAGGTGGPNLTVPLAGDYLSENSLTQHGGGGAGIYMQAEWDSETLTDNLAAVSYDEEQSGLARRKVTGVAEGVSVNSQYRITAGSMSARLMMLQILPVRVGRT